jgi:hypothetical protein
MSGLTQTPPSTGCPHPVEVGLDPAAAVPSITAAAERTQTPGKYVGEAESRESDPLPRNIAARLATASAECMIWLGATDRGYGRVSIDGKVQRVHRVVWELMHGPIPEGLTIDHLCRVPSCCNTAHMELVTGAENSRRGAVARAAEKAPLLTRRTRPSGPRHVSTPFAPPTTWEAAVWLMDRLIEPLGDHWIWVGYVDPNGYATFQLGEQKWRPHRLLWEVNNGPLGKSVLYRNCEADNCCNPGHQTFGKASRMRTHCVEGHELTPENLYEYPEHGIRTCRRCASTAAAARRRRKRAA